MKAEQIKQLQEYLSESLVSNLYQNLDVFTQNHKADECSDDENDLVQAITNVIEDDDGITSETIPTLVKITNSLIDVAIKQKELERKELERKELERKELERKEKEQEQLRKQQQLEKEKSFFLLESIKLEYDI